MNIREQVKEFHEAFGQPVVAVPAVPSDERIQLRFRLVREEFEELVAALGLNAYGAPVSALNLEAVADALADLEYVLIGTSLEFGIDLGPVVDEVHRSNLSKLGADGKPVYREDGKVTKGPNYSPPDIRGELMKQGYKP